MTERRKDGTREGHGESSIAPLFQSGAIKTEMAIHTAVFSYQYNAAIFRNKLTILLVFEHIGFSYNSFLPPFQDFSSYETDQSVGGPKMGEPLREKPPGTSTSRTWLVSRNPCRARTHARHRGESIYFVKNEG